MTKHPWSLVGRVGLSRRMNRVARHAGSTHSQRLQIEPLERRQLLSASPQMLVNLNDDTSGIEPGPVVSVDGTAFFVADDGVSGRELWASDGTSNGTRLVADISPGPTSSSPRDLTDVGGLLYFSAFDATHGYEFWVSDGTSSGTRLVADLRAGGGSSGPFGFTALGGGAVFVANDGTTGKELWFSDGTSTGTQLVRDIRPGSASGTYGGFLEFGGLVYFLANDGAGGNGLWRTDGTSNGTELVFAGQISLGSSEAGESPLGELNGELYFRLADSLWKSDGTSLGTSLVYEWTDGGPVDPFHLSRLTVFENRLYFSANDGATGYELWSTDGTSSGTLLVKETFPGTYQVGEYLYPHSGQPSDFTIASGVLYFRNAQGLLWKTNGTPAGTLPVAGVVEPVELVELNGSLVFAGASLGRVRPDTGTPEVLHANPAGLPTFSPKYLANVAGTLFFSGNQASSGRELWRSDGTSAGTLIVEDVAVPPGNSSDPTDFVTLGADVLFAADGGDGRGRELWRTNGTATGTTLAQDVIPGQVGSNPTGLTVWNGKVYFAANHPSQGRELFQSDGTSSGTKVINLAPSGSSNPGNFTPAGGQLFFTANDGVNGTELWRTDGTTSGTRMVRDLTSGGSSSLNWLTDVNGQLFFALTEGVGTNLWTSDGTSAGTRRLLGSIAPFAQPFPAELVNLGGKLYFTTAASGELWTSDGTSSGTTLAVDIRPGSDKAGVNNLVNVGGKLYFIANDGISGVELWTSDGTPAGTALVVDTTPGPSGTGFHSLVGGDRLYFITSPIPPSSGNPRVWTTDGTSSGTVLLQEVDVAGATNPPVVIGSRLYFVADDGVHGRELWTSDGTSSGTRMVSDSLPGLPGTDPSELTAAGGTLYYSATQPGALREPWLLASSAPALVGDANGDGSVGAADYALWAAQFGLTGPGLTADFDGNGEVGLGDYALWAANFGASNGGANTAAAASPLAVGVPASAGTPLIQRAILPTGTLVPADVHTPRPAGEALARPLARAAVDRLFSQLGSQVHRLAPAQVIHTAPVPTTPAQAPSKFTSLFRRDR